MTDALRNNLTDAEAVYFDELKQAGTKLKVLKQRVQRVDREGRKAGNIHWAHVGDIKHVNELLKEALDFEFGNFQPRTANTRKLFSNQNKRAWRSTSSPGSMQKRRKPVTQAIQR